MKHSIDLLVVERPVIALDDEYPAGTVDPMHNHARTQIYVRLRRGHGRAHR